MVKYQFTGSTSMKMPLVIAPRPKTTAKLGIRLRIRGLQGVSSVLDPLLERSMPD
jgi:hypothetical protein